MEKIKILNEKEANLHKLDFEKEDLRLLVFLYCDNRYVTLIQAYIFTMLTALFIGMAVHQEH